MCDQNEQFCIWHIFTVFINVVIFHTENVLSMKNKKGGTTNHFSFFSAVQQSVTFR